MIYSAVSEHLRDVMVGPPSNLKIFAVFDMLLTACGLAYTVRRSKK